MLTFEEVRGTRTTTRGGQRATGESRSRAETRLRRSARRRLSTSSSSLASRSTFRRGIIARGRTSASRGSARRSGGRSDATDATRRRRRRRRRRRGTSLDRGARALGESVRAAPRGACGVDSRARAGVRESPRRGTDRKRRSFLTRPRPTSPASCASLVRGFRNEAVITRRSAMTTTCATSRALTRAPQ